MTRFPALASMVLLALGLTSCISGIIPPTKSKLSTQEIIQHEGRSTVALVYQVEDDGTSETSETHPICTGVWVDATHILSANHCTKHLLEMAQEKQDAKEKAHQADIDNCSGMKEMLGLCSSDEVIVHKVIKMEGLSVHYIVWNEIEGIGKDPTGQHLSKVVGWDAPHDLTLLEAQGRAIPVHPVAALAKSAPELGEKLYFCGHVRGFYWTFVEGTVAGYHKDLPGASTHGPFMQVDASINHGHSGGGAFNEYGELVGVADLITRVPNMAMYIHLDVLREFLVTQKIVTAPAKS